MKTPEPALRPPLPVLAVDDLQVHVDSGDEHLTVDANLVDGRRREGVSHHHHPHDLIGHRAAVRQRHPDAKTSRDVDHLGGEEKTDRRRKSLYLYSILSLLLLSSLSDKSPGVTTVTWHRSWGQFWSKQADRRELLWILPLIWWSERNRKKERKKERKKDRKKERKKESKKEELAVRGRVKGVIIRGFKLVWSFKSLSDATDRREMLMSCCRSQGKCLSFKCSVTFCPSLLPVSL